MTKNGQSRAPSVEYEWVNDPEEAETTRVNAIQYATEKAALRPIGKGQPVDEYPVYLLEDATIFNERGEYGNLLNAELDGEYTVCGKLVLERGQWKDLKNSKYNNSYITFKTSAFSVGAGPILLWAIGEYKYFEIRPACRYRDMYRWMMEAISIYFNMIDVCEAQSKMKLPTLEEILFQYAYLDGSGLSLNSCVERIKRHGEFLLSQMKKSEGIEWKSTVFYKWLSYECSGIYSNLMEKSGESTKPPAPIHLPARKPSEQNASLELFVSKKEKPIIHKAEKQVYPVEAPVSRPYPHHSRRKKETVSTPSSKSSTKLANGVPPEPSHQENAISSLEGSSAYTGSIVVPTTYDRSTPVGTILCMIYASVHNDIDVVPPRFFYKPERLTYKQISVALYYLHQIKSRELPPIGDQVFSNAIMEYYAADIIAALDPSWQNTNIYRQLAEVAQRQESYTEKDKLAHRWPEISTYQLKRRAHVEKDGQKWGKFKARPSDVGSMATPVSTPVASGPHPGPSAGGKSSKKAIPPFRPGRRSGKEAGLRLTSTLLKRDSSAVSSSPDPEEVAGGRQSKKRRRIPTPPEMGPSSDSEPEIDLPIRPLHPSTSNEEEEEEEEELPSSQPEITIVSEPITQEGCFVSGRMGSWVCSYCEFAVWDPEAEEGLETAREHMREEAARIAREELVSVEADKTRLPSSHLLELIKAKGREAKLRAKAERMVNGKEAPEPIKRARI